ncbi:hypothetical protein [Roseicella sp. DB1501]|uniref:argonaute/piwi family protein n=1 Tax=Roseicella sp. DB1501 TaxID=2730925 RepID=UPI0014930660|nr:hypothetical protein [Roseicella sp. DB1501]NOG73928.1 hypothetical protein [Roseicella sp. DB1501]
MIDLSILELPPPKLQFGGASAHSDPKAGLLAAGPFDLRFGSARKDHVHIGIVGTDEQVAAVAGWLERCSQAIPVLGDPSPLKRPFPGFEDAFHKRLVSPLGSRIRLSTEKEFGLSRALDGEPYECFQRVVDLYSEAHARLALRDLHRPDIVLMCIPDEVLAKVSAVERKATEVERQGAKDIRRARAGNQLDLFDVLDEVEQTPEDFLRRDLRLALKAKALRLRLPIQIVTNALIHDTPRNQDPATRAWNFSVGLYYKAGGVPWRLPPRGPDTCFVGISFHHFRTTKRAIVRSSLAQAFSSDGEGFAIRGGGVPVEPGQTRNLHLSQQQAFDLARDVLKEYELRTGGAPLRVVLHKTSHFDDAELAGFQTALKDIPVVSMVTLVPSLFRLLRYGAYPPKVGTLCTVNGDRSFLFTSGFMPELGTYPGPHVPQPFEVRCCGSENAVAAAQDVLNLTRMNWNTAEIKGKWPVSLSFARRVGGILDEYGDDDLVETSFRYFV